MDAPVYKPRERECGHPRMKTRGPYSHCPDCDVQLYSCGRRKTRPSLGARRVTLRKRKR